jgi:Fe-S cluster assembly protein SufD
MTGSILKIHLPLVNSIIAKMETYTDPRNRFEALFKVFETSLNGHQKSKYHEYRKNSILNLSKLDFPSTRDENWKYTSVSRILQPGYTVISETKSKSQSLPVFEKIQDSIQLIYHNGHFQGEIPGNLPEGVKIMSIEDALENKEYAGFIENNFLKSNHKSDDIFTHLNQSFSKDGFFVVVDENIKIKNTIHIIHYAQSSGTPILLAPSMFVWSKKNSEIVILEQHISETGGSEILSSVVNQFVIEKNASVHHTKLQQINEQDFMIYKNEVKQDRDSHYRHFNAELGGRLVRNTISVVQQETNVQSDLYGIFIGSGEQHSDSQTSIDHASPHGISNELYRSLLSGKSRSVFNGKVIVRPDAQKINAFQQNDTLLLSERARIDSKPQLEIFADDVRCSHGATIGQLDAELLFYLKSRGLNIDESRILLLWAFIGKVTEYIAHPEIKDLIEKYAREKVLQLTVSE